MAVAISRDGVIEGYRELLVGYSRMPDDVRDCLRRVPNTFFHDPDAAMPDVHALDLAPDGHIDRHVDSVKVRRIWVQLAGCHLVHVVVPGCVCLCVRLCLCTLW